MRGGRRGPGKGGTPPGRGQQSETTLARYPMETYPVAMGVSGWLRVVDGGAHGSTAQPGRLADRDGGSRVAGSGGERGPARVREAADGRSTGRAGSGTTGTSRASPTARTSAFPRVTVRAEGGRGSCRLRCRGWGVPPPHRRSSCNGHRQLARSSAPDRPASSAAMMRASRAMAAGPATGERKPASAS